MKEFQKIAIGLLGLTNPELFAPRPSASIDRLREQGARLLRAARFTLTALAAGSRTVALADNGGLVRDLAVRAEQLYGSK